MGDQATSATSSVTERGYQRGTGTGDWDQYVNPVDDRIVSFLGRASTFLTPGRGAASQKILALHNATGSTVLVNVNRIRVDILNAAPKVIGTIPPIIRVHRFTALPTGGNLIVKTPMDTGGNSNSAVTVWQDASADATSSTTTLTITIPTTSVLAQVYGPRQLGANTTAGSASSYEPVDTITFFENEPDITLRPLEGVCVFLDQTVAAGNLTTDKWAAVIDWQEYARP